MTGAGEAEKLRRAAGKETIDSPAAFLTTVTTRLAINELPPSSSSSLSSARSQGCSPPYDRPGALPDSTCSPR
jgi:hypothetical protein